MPSKTRFVDPAETVRLPLSDGDWVEVRRCLSNAENLRILSAAASRVSAPSDGGAVAMDIGRWMQERLLVWLRAWSFAGPDGQPVPPTAAAIAGLAADTAGEIHDAISRYEAALREARAAAAVSGAERLLSQALDEPEGEGEAGTTDA